MHYCTVELGGKEVKVYEPPRRTAFRLLGEAVQLASKMGIKQDSTPELVDVGKALTVVPELLDLVFTVTQESKESKAEIEETFEVQELMLAYTKVVEMLTTPLSGSTKGSLVQEDREPGTSLPSGE